MRNRFMSGGYPQLGYHARPPTYRAQRGPSPQYNQPPYSGGYATGRNQSSAPRNQQPPHAHGAPTDGCAYRYGYGQPQAQKWPRNEQAPGAQGGHIAARSGAQRPPSSYYSTSQPRYGAPPAIQSSYVRPSPYSNARRSTQPPPYK